MWNRHAFELKSRIMGADISPDDRFVAVFAVNSDDISDRQPDELVCDVQIWDWREGGLVLRRIVLRRLLVDYRKLHLEEPLVRYADGGSKLIVSADDHLLVLDAGTLNTIQDIDLGTSRLPWLNATVGRPSEYEFSTNCRH